MPSKNVQTNSQNNREDDTPVVEVQPQPVRELTQTDKLNKKLLLSFLERINESSVPLAETVREDTISNNTDNEFA